jgi:hypothetical protein
MKMMYCWRCGIDVPMLDEEEFAVVDTLYARAVRAVKAHWDNGNLQKQRDFILEQYRPVLEAYQCITGREHATHPSDLMHHRISKYGPPCLHCGRPLRTPRATYCASCGTARPTS